MNSGAVEAFNTRTGVCFDYASLYTAMCRAVGLKVRLLTGLGYDGLSWGDHAWNQVYIPEEDRWVNVDATFGTITNYFDKPDFHADHRDATVQGEW
jgi:transglutaminase-like putative cysteine protease